MFYTVILLHFFYYNICPMKWDTIQHISYQDIYRGRCIVYHIMVADFLLRVARTVEARAIAIQQKHRSIARDLMPGQELTKTAIVSITIISIGAISILSIISSISTSGINSCIIFNEPSSAVPASGAVRTNLGITSHSISN